MHDGDSRAGLDVASKKEVLKIMKSRKVNFDEARQLFIVQKLAKNGIAPDGRPMGKLFSFELHFCFRQKDLTSTPIRSSGCLFFVVTIPIVYAIFEPRVSGIWAWSSLWFIFQLQDLVPLFPIMRVPIPRQR